jgi:glycosyltransferase involved in cell wall biosynthesis
MRELLAAVFWISGATLLYIYAGYPLLVGVLARVFGREPQRGDAAPPVSLLIPAYNEEAHLEAKLRNCAALDYPANRLRVVVASDGSTDRTNAIADAWRDRGVRLFALPENIGKSAMLSHVVPRLTGEIIVFTDASSRLEREALRRLVRAFADPSVGSVCGLYRTRAGESLRDEGEGLYWRYETWIKRQEGRLHSILGAHGAFYAIRRSLFRPLEAGTINDDYVIPMQVVAQGFRAVYEPAAAAWEEELASVESEFVRRRRIAAGNCQQVRALAGLLHPRVGWVAFCFFSHKVLRTAAPLLLVGLLLGSLGLASPWRGVAWAAQGLLYGTALLGAWGQAHGRVPKLAAAPYYFCLGNAALAAGLWQYARRGARVPWGRPGRAAAAPARVLVVAPEPFYEDRGTPIAIRHVLEALSHLDYDVDVLTLPVGQSPAIPGVRYLRVGNWLGVREVPIGFSLRKVWFDAFLCSALWRQLRRERYIAIHAVEEAAYLAAFASRGRVPVIYDMQSSLADQMARRWWLKWPPAERFLYACEAWLLRQAARTACSTGLAVRARAMCPDATITEWRYPSPATAPPHAEVSRIRAALGIPQGRRVVVYTGNFSAYQGVDLLAEAMPRVLAAMPEAVFVFVGADGANGAEMERLIRSRAPAEAVRLLKRQPREDMPPVLALADVLVSPRAHGENLPLKVLDYLAAGRPIVATAIPAHRAMLSEEHAVLTAPTPEGLADGITALLTDPARAEAMQARCRTFAQEQLGWLTFVRAVGRLYEDVTWHG